LAVVIKKQETSQQVVTRMQDLASEFSKNFRGWYPRTLTVGGSDPLPHPTPSSAFDQARRASAPVLGPKFGPPQLFSRGCAPTSSLINGEKFCGRRGHISICHRLLEKKLIMRWDSEREPYLRRRDTRTTKYNRLVQKFPHRSTRLCVGTQVYQIQWNNAM